MKNILFVRSTPYNEDINGYNVQGIGIAKAFCRLGYNCDYLNFDTDRDEVIDLCECNQNKARVIYKKRTRIFRTGINFEVLSKDFLQRYDIVICREYNQLMSYLIAKRHPNTSIYSGPYWNMFMIPFFSNIYDFLITKKLNKLAKNKFVKSQLAKEFLEKKGYDNVIDVGVGLDTSRFENVVCTKNTQNIVDYMSKNRCVLYVGTLDENKNLPFILKVFAKLLEKEPDVKLVLIGKSKQSLKNKLLGMNDKSYYANLINSVPSKVKDSIMHIDRVDNPELKYIYPLAKAFILPSIHEIFGMVMLEAMYFGAPVITSLNGGSSTLIKTNDYGIKIDNYDVEEWVAGLVKYLEDSEYSKQVVEKCKCNIRENYTWKSICLKMLKSIND